MKIFVMVDLEGISGIYSSSQVMSDGAHYGEGRLYATLDTNACVEGCFAGGASKVVVYDAHLGSSNLLWEKLDPRGEYIMGKPYAQRMPGIGSFDGLILLGYHAMAGTRLGLLEHTMSSRSWQNFWMNGRKTGEIGMDAAMAGDSGVPTIMVSGDDKACREARSFLPGVVTAQVKVGLAVESARMLSAERAHHLIAGCAEKAVMNCRRIKPLRVRKPVRLRVELVSRGQVPWRCNPHVRMVDSRTYEATGATVLEALARVW
jgi:D-amino peptidase